MNAISSLVLVFVTVAMGLGWVAVAASLSLDAPGHDDVGRWSPSISIDQADTSGPAAFGVPQGGEDLITLHPTGTQVPGSLPPVISIGPLKSPLYPQNGGTLWDRIRVSSKRDRRAFLLGSAIQIHAPAAAATPGPRFDPPPCCPRT
jgi:hypothetical protein